MRSNWDRTTRPFITKGRTSCSAGSGSSPAKNDDFVKSPDASLRFILRRCSVFRGHVPIPLGFRNMSPTPHSSAFARLACGLFTKPPPVQSFYDFLRVRLLCLPQNLQHPPPFIPAQGTRFYDENLI